MVALDAPPSRPGRWLLAFLGACLMALALFALMLSMVTPPRNKLPPDPLSVANFVRVDGRNETTATRSRQQAPEPPRPDTPQPPTPPTPVPATAQTNLPKLDLALPSLDMGIAVSAAPTPSLAGLSAAPPAAAGPQGAAAGGPDNEVVPLNDVPPQYPEQARRRGIEGHIKLAFTITAQGRVENIRVLEASPPNVFDREARRAVSRWRFAPRMENGQAVAREATKTLQFRLR